MLFWNSLAFSMIQRMLAIWSLVPLPFLNPACTSGSSQFTYCWSLTWRMLSITLPACKLSISVEEFEHSLVLPFFGIDLLQSLWPLLSFPNLLAYWVQHFNSIIFWILSSSAGILSSIGILKDFIPLKNYFVNQPTCFAMVLTFYKQIYKIGLHFIQCQLDNFKNRIFKKLF